MRRERPDDRNETGKADRERDLQGCRRDRYVLDDRAGGAPVRRRSEVMMPAQGDGKEQQQNEDEDARALTEMGSDNGHSTAL